MTSELSFMISGVVFGLSGGLTPGPLFTLVVSETLKHGVKEGIKVSTVPLFSDLPIVLSSVFLVSRISNMFYVLGTIAILGAVFLLYLGYEGLVFTGFEVSQVQMKPQSFKKGLLANFLNPNPYLFWITIGAPTVVRAIDINAISAVLFIVFMYLCLVGSKILVAFVVSKSKRFLKSKNYIYTIRILGAVLILFAFIFVKQGFESFGLL